MKLEQKRTALWAAVLTLIFVVALPVVSYGQGRGHGRGQSRKSDIFVNGHDARDGRYDGRGPRAHRHDRDDDDDRDYDDDDYNRGNRRNRNYGGYGNNGGYGNYNNIYRLAADRGYQDGLNTGAEDAQRGQSYDPQRSHYYRNATYGYDSSYGNKEAYKQAYRDGFRRGYDEGFRQYGGYNNNGGYRRSGSRVGDILGGVFGRP